MRLNPSRDADIPLPRYMTALSSGMDIHAAVKTATELDAGQILLVPTGLALSIPPGYEGQIRPRSGLAINHGISVINAPGTIDADYRGEIKVGLINLSDRSFTIQRGDRIAQMVIQQVCQVGLELVEELDPTDRDRGGFGHTGID